MVTDVGNILSAAQARQLNALRATSKTLDTSELRLATGRRVNSVLDNAQSFFAARGLGNRANDLQRLLDGIGQGLQVIKAAEDGIQGSIGLLNNAEAFLEQTARDIDDGFLDGPNIVIPGAGPPLPGDLTTTVNDILAANPGAITEGGGVIVQRYNSAGSFTFNAPVGVSSIEYVVVGGGGGGGSSTSFSNAGSGGGGGGGVVTGTMTVSGPINITIGAGGNAGAVGNNSGQQGGDTTFGTITALGGGFGIGGNGSGGPGGSGGGGRGGTAGTGLQSGSPSGGLGNDGGTGASPAGAGGGGGGGATGVGGALSNISGGSGGSGFTFNIGGVDEFFGAGGGGGGAQNDAVGVGGSGVGGNGANNGTAATAGLDGTGSGGGGGNNNRVGASGGDGAVIIRYTVTAPGGGNSDLILTPQQQLELKYAGILEQLDLLVLDSSYRGTDLLNGDDLTLFFNESRSSSLLVEGINASSAALGLQSETIGSIEDTELRIAEIREARETLRLYGNSLSNDLNITKIREVGLNQMINVLEEGSDNLTLVDQNKEGARLLSLAVREQIQLSVLAIRAPSLVDFLF